MKDFLVMRTFATRCRWRIKANSKEEATALLKAAAPHDDLNALAFEKSEREFLGPVTQVPMLELTDIVLELEG